MPNYKQLEANKRRWAGMSPAEQMAVWKGRRGKKRWHHSPADGETHRTGPDTRKKVFVRVRAILRMTARGILVRFGSRDVWLPRRLITNPDCYREGDGESILEMPLDLAERKKLLDTPKKKRKGRKRRNRGCQPFEKRPASHPAPFPDSLVAAENHLRAIQRQIAASK